MQQPVLRALGCGCVAAAASLAYQQCLPVVLLLSCPALHPLPRQLPLNLAMAALTAVITFCSSCSTTSGDRTHSPP